VPEKQDKNIKIYFDPGLFKNWDIRLFAEKYITQIFYKNYGWQICFTSK